MNVLIVCTANVSRSPSAEYVFREHARRAGCNAEIRSRGIVGDGGLSHHPPLREVLRRAGYSPGKTPRPSVALTAADVEWASVVIAMERRHVSEMMLRFGEPRRHVLFMELAGHGPVDTPDPYILEIQPAEFLPLAESAARAFFARRW